MLKRLPRPNLSGILPNKKTINRFLFDNDSRLAYKKTIPILHAVYSGLDNPSDIVLPSYTKHTDLMMCKDLLSTVRTTTSAANKHLVDLENELVEQAAELGNNDAIAILAFETIRNPSSKDDYNYANKLIKQLSDIKHPLVFKLAGDFAFSKKFYPQAEEYYLQFIELEPDTILASHVYLSLGSYYFSYAEPRDLTKAKLNFEKSIKFGELDKATIQAHYYLGQMHAVTDPQVAKYHFELAASKGLQECFASLGFLESNVFNNYAKALEWFKLGVEATNDVTCLVGQFDCYVSLKESKNAVRILTELMALRDKLKRVAALPQFKEQMESNKALVEMFFRTRKDTIAGLKIA